MIIEAGLAEEALPIVDNEQRDGAAVDALVVGELIAMLCANFLAVSKFDLGAFEAKKVLLVHIFAHRTFIVIFASAVNLLALVAVVESHLNLLCTVLLADLIDDFLGFELCRLFVIK